MKIKQQVEKILSNRRAWELRAGFSDPSQREVIKSYSHLKEIVDTTFNSVPVLAKIQSGIGDGTEAEFIIKSTIAFNLRLYDSLSSKINGLNLFASESSSAEELNLLFLLLWKQSVYSMISTFLLMRESLYFQAMQVMRGYIESSAVIYLSLLDRKFFINYSANDLTRDEYMKLWFNELKPSKIAKKIYDIHSEWRQIDKTEGIEYIGARSLSEDIFTTSLINNVYNDTSDFVHFNRDALLSSSTGDKEGHFYIDVREGSYRKQQDLYVVMANLFPMLSGLIEMLIPSGQKIVEYNKMMGDFSCIIKEMRLSPLH